MELRSDSNSDRTRVLLLKTLKYMHHFLGESVQYFDGTRTFDRFYPFLVVCDSDDPPMILDEIQVGLKWSSGATNKTPDQTPW